MRLSLRLSVALLLFFAMTARAEDSNSVTSDGTAKPTPVLPVATVATPLPGGSAAIAADEPRLETVFEYGFEQRVRSETWNNVMDLSDGLADARQQVRFRSRAWMNIPVSKNVDFFVGLVDEYKKQSNPDLKFSGDEVVFESLYLDIKRTFVPGLTMRIGRQNLVRGEGFILFDGTAGDGSRSTYFNAVNISYKVRKSEFELIGILNPKQDRMLPGINDQHRFLNDWDDQAIGLYYSDRNHSNTDVDAYYFYKKEVHNRLPVTNAAYAPDRHVNTGGARLVRRLPRDFTFATEGAVQWGAQHPTNAVRGWAGYAYVKKTWNRKWKPYVQGGYWAFSGDDPSTAKVEGWDPIFGRTGKWGDTYMYTAWKEKGLGYWTNNRMTQVEVGFSPWKPIGFKGAWYHMDAFHPYPGASSMFGRGKRRGEYATARMDYTISPSVKGHITLERIFAGDFYTGANNSYFFRAEVIYQFKGAWKRRSNQYE
ncbi:MAG TPA: hypothetical protein VD837_01735 [Terriglobales bacterium]|nr:hypothetical protein [Terriglobales bacterium]